MKKIFINLSIFFFLITGIIGIFWTPFLWAYAIVIPLIVIGVRDMTQKKQTLKRNYPLIGRMRWWAEWMRPKVYQYFIESDTDGAPYNRLSRNVIYQRAKKVNDTTPFGTQLNVYETGYEWLNHSINPLHHDKVDHDPRVLVGGPDCLKPYSASFVVMLLA